MSKTMKQSVIRRAREIYALHPEMSARQVATFISSEFPQITDRTLYDYCKPSAVGLDVAMPTVYSEYDSPYFYNDTDDVYMVYSPHRAKPLIMPGDLHRSILSAYSWDGEGCTIRECAEKFELEYKEMRWYLKAFRFEHGSLPLTDEEVADSINDPEETTRLAVKTLAGQKGKITRQAQKLKWRQTVKDAAAFRSFEAQTEKIANIMGETLIRYTPPKIIKPAAKSEHLLASLNLYDLHIGARDFNNNAATFPRATVNELMAASEADEIILAFGGDYFHVDTDKGATTRGTLQDTAVNPREMYRTGYEEAVTTVLDALKVFRKVKVVVVAGNHDHMGCVQMEQFFIHLTHWMRLAGHDVEMVTGATENLVVMRHGVCLLGYEHGDGPKPAKLVEVLHTVYRKLWGQTQHTYIHTGHMHHAYERDINGALVMQQPTSVKADRYHQKHGYETSEAALRLHEYDSKRGLMTIRHRIVK